MSTKLEFSRGEVLAAKYEVVDLLDESPLGVTYRTKHIKTGKYVRLILLRPRVAGREQKDALVEAYKQAKALSHPHLVKVGELGEHAGVAYLTYEDFEGGTLRDLLQEYRINNKTFALKEAAQITQQILEALDAVHQAGLTMRALRPEYVLVKVTYTGPRKQTFVAQTKIVGAAFWDLVPTAVLTEDEFTRGEAQYIAPELKSFDPVATPRSDVYSAGVIFYEALVGAAPVGSYLLPKSRRPELPDHVNTVAELALAQSPDDRYPSCGDFATDLQRTFQEGAFEEGQGKPLMNPIAWVLAFTLVLFVAVIVFALRPNPEKTAELADATIREQVYKELQETAPPPDEFKQVYERHPPNMIYVPAGPFVAGRLHADPASVSSEPLAERRETRGYLIDVFEYPNLKGGQPAFQVTYADAEQRCAEAGKRLCSSDEWERACKGPRSLIYAYGDTYDPEFCGAGLEDQAYPSGAADKCKSEFGVFDLSGNFREWTSTSKKPGRTLVKGGLRGNPEKGTRCAHAEDESTGYADGTLSFRCCRDLDAHPLVAPQ